jgi:hypothetical protein
MIFFAMPLYPDILYTTIIHALFGRLPRDKILGELPDFLALGGYSRWPVP